jgi:hypothetical protein
MPQTTRVIFHSLNPIRLHLISLFIKLSRLIILDDFHVGAANRSEDPSSIEMIAGKLFELFNRFHAVIAAEVVIAIGIFLQKRHQIYINKDILEDSADCMLFFRRGSCACPTFLPFYYSSFLFLDMGVDIMAFLLFT